MTRRLCFFLSALLAIFSLSLQAQESTATPAMPTVSPRLNLANPYTKSPSFTAVWVHPESPLLSAILVSDGDAGRLTVYDLNGRVLDNQSVVRPGMVDVRYNIPLAGKKADLVLVSQLDKGYRLRLYTIDRQARTLTRVDNEKIYVGKHVGACLFRSLRNGRLYAVITTDKGEIKQIPLVGNKDGQIEMIRDKITLHRVPGPCSGVLADDETGKLYVAQKQRCVWMYGAEPDDTSKGKAVIDVGKNGLQPDIQSLALYPRTRGRGYIVVTSQGNHSFRIYDRKNYRFIGGFQVRNVVNPLGLSLSSIDFSPVYPNGLFLCNSRPANAKARAFGLPFRQISELAQRPLPVNRNWNPRDLEFIPTQPDGNASRADRGDRR